ncbi:MAG TPA: hypothetical protein VI542_01485, partial [Candidatus Tectomicrobia bacterium]
ISDGTTDVMPRPGTADEQLVRMWKPDNNAEQLSLEFRLRRAIRSVPVTTDSTQTVLSTFDDMVRLTEEGIIAARNSKALFAPASSGVRPRPAGAGPGSVRPRQD